MANTLHIAVVNVHVLPDRIEDFRAASLLNASGSRQEPGVVRFDVLQDSEDSTRFVLIEVFRDKAGAAAHRETAHYQRWRDTVAEMMAEPRAARKYVNVSPDDAGW
jgi:(4S)-4-hydroxy-5-phosphonooxypentane-2,3-dione isomerase